MTAGIKTGGYEILALLVAGNEIVAPHYTVTPVRVAQAQPSLL
jgi:hypothetical protein